MPSETNKYVRSNFEKDQKNKQLLERISFFIKFSLLIVIIFFVFKGISVLSQNSYVKLFLDIAQVTPTPLYRLSPPKDRQDDSTQSANPNVPTPTRKFTRLSLPSPSPTPIPPIVTILYPDDNQAIVFPDANHQFCVTEMPSGGDLNGLQRRENINNAGWSNYKDVQKLCFNPKIGANIFSLQYRNQAGRESEIITRQFTFQIASPTPTFTQSSCTQRVTFSERKSGNETIVSIAGAWYMTVGAKPDAKSVEFDPLFQLIILHFDVSWGTIYVYNGKTATSPLCATYKFGS